MTRLVFLHQRKMKREIEDLLKVAKEYEIETSSDLENFRIKFLVKKV